MLTTKEQKKKLKKQSYLRRQKWQEYTEELYKKDLHDPDNPNGVITHTHQEPDILEYEVRWALGSITMNKTSEGDESPDELFQVLKMML